jgi:hypothetical protein
MRLASSNERGASDQRTEHLRADFGSGVRDPRPSFLVLAITAAIFAVLLKSAWLPPRSRVVGSKQ